MKRTKEYMTTIELKKSINEIELKKLKYEIETAFSNSKNTISNDSKDLYVFIFQGNNSEWECLRAGTYAIVNNTNLQSKIKDWTWEEDNKDECINLLGFFRDRGYAI